MVPEGRKGIEESNEKEEKEMKYKDPIQVHSKPSFA